MTSLPDLNRLTLDELFRELTKSGLAERLLELARDEDLGTAGVPGDVTTQSWLEKSDRSGATILAKQSGSISGLAFIPLLIDVYSAAVEIRSVAHDGQRVVAGSPICRVEGDVCDLLALERPALNLLGRMSGIATATARFCDAIRESGTAANLFDTRKTTPGLRIFEKYAVRCGGGFLHRLGLHDAVLLKDNHLARASGRSLGLRVQQAALKARSIAPLRFVEVEVDELEQLRELVRLPVGVIDIVLLDNMTPTQLRQAVELRDSAGARFLLEASGGITLQSVGEVARTGVERISTGAVTHSASSLDVSMEIDALSG